MSVCRVCLQSCDANKRLSDRNFREKAQDIFSLLIDVSKKKDSQVACDLCYKRVNKYYAFKHKCRQQEEKLKDPDQKPISVGFSVRDETPVDENGDAATTTTTTNITSDNNSDDSCDDYGLEPVPFEEPKKKRRGPPPTRLLLRFTKEQLAMKSKKELYEERRKVICEQCGKSVQDVRMESHLNAHLGVRPYACVEPGCGVSFRCAQSRLIHVKRNHVNGQHPCEECGKVLGSKLSLRTHMYSHKEKQFKCELCGLMCLTRSRLELHMRVHTQKRDYKCPHCPKSFYVNSVLTLHLRSHSGEKPYVCHVCQAAYSHRILYVKHMKKFHPAEEIYKLVDMLKMASAANAANGSS